MNLHLSLLALVLAIGFVEAQVDPIIPEYCKIIDFEYRCTECYPNIILFQPENQCWPI